MRTYLDCIPCFVRHCLEAVRMTTDDERIHQRVLRQGFRLAGEIVMDRLLIEQLPRASAEV
jgi:uncharacterized protein with ATP-grasp and redox domains